jgi:lauroyl/myristoyl acyltransferase
MFALSGMIGRLTYPFSPDPSAADVGSLLPDLPPRRLRRIAREIRAHTFKNVDLVTVLNHAGLESIFPVVRCRGGDFLREMHARGQPAILISWHIGAHFYTIVAGLHRLGVPAHFLGQDFGKRLPPGFGILPPGKTLMDRALSVRRALQHLRQGGALVIALDGADGDSTFQASFMGRQVCLRRGPALLARLSGAPLIPIIQSWESWSGAVTLEIHKPLPHAHFSGDKDSFDSALLTAAMSWFEAYLRASPERLSLGKLDTLLSAPRITDVLRCSPVNPTLVSAQ